MIYIQFERFLDCLEDFWIGWRISGQSKRIPYIVENVLDSLEDFRVVLDISGQFGRFADSLEDFRTLLSSIILCERTLMVPDYHV